MTCCVIGGAGFIGAALVSLLCQEGRDVRVIGRSASPQRMLPLSARYISCDVNQRAALREALEGATEIVDLAYATVPKTSFADPMFDLTANLPPALVLMEEAMLLPQLKRFVFVSSGGTVYGEQAKLPITEDAPTMPISPYGITKLAIERYALMFHRLRGLPAIVVRPANAYGVGQKAGTGQGFLATAIAQILKGRPVTVFGDRGTVRDYIEVGDIAAGIHAALFRGEPGSIYNIGTGTGLDNVGILEMLRPLALQDGLSVTVEHAPARHFDVLANILDSGRLQVGCGWRPRVAFSQGLASLWKHAENDPIHP
jgi:UDP-glucose 4-epimerase